MISAASAVVTRKARAGAARLLPLLFVLGVAAGCGGGDSDAGDVVRTLRMAIQMMRQVRSTLGKNDALAARLDDLDEREDLDQKNWSYAGTVNHVAAALRDLVPAKGGDR